MKRPPVFLQNGGSCLSTIVMTISLIGCLTYQFLQNQLPGALTDIFKKNDQIHDHNTRLSKLLHKPLSKTNVRKFTVVNKGVDIYNILVDEIRDSRSSYSFKCKLRIFIMREEVE